MPPTYRPLDFLDHSLLSPSGRMSKRARRRVLDRLGDKLFGPESGFVEPEVPQPSEKEYLTRKAALLREMAARGMYPRKYKKEADRLEALAAEIEEDTDNG